MWRARGSLVDDIAEGMNEEGGGGGGVDEGGRGGGGSIHGGVLVTL